jgi:hypothetical protein
LLDSKDRRKIPKIISEWFPILPINELPLRGSYVKARGRSAQIPANLKKFGSKNRANKT